MAGVLVMRPALTGVRRERRAALVTACDWESLRTGGAGGVWRARGVGAPGYKAAVAMFYL